MQYDRSVIDEYGRPLDQSLPHRSGPKVCEKKYFFYTGNTVYGVQNLEYDAYTQTWLVAVYAGKKQSFDNFRMFFIDGKIPAAVSELTGRSGEKGAVLVSAYLGTQGKQENICGTMFEYGQTGMVSMGDGTFYFSHHGQDKENKLFYTNVKKHLLVRGSKNIFSIEEYPALH